MLVNYIPKYIKEKTFQTKDDKKKDEKRRNIASTFLPINAGKKDVEISIQRRRKNEFATSINFWFFFLAFFTIKSEKCFCNIYTCAYLYIYYFLFFVMQKSRNEITLRLSSWIILGVRSLSIFLVNWFN